jgi:ribosomal protein S1
LYVPEAVEDREDVFDGDAPSSIHELKRKMRLTGTVSRIELFGAFVDVGVGSDGLVHISQMSTQRINRVSDVAEVGDEVTVWVINVEPDKKRLDLTMIEPAAVEWDDIRAGQVYSGTVKRLERFGAFVDIGSTRDGLVHVSEITSDYIQDAKDYVRVGDEVQVKVLQVDRQRRRIELSMKALEEHLLEEEELGELEEEPTAIELAWREARGGRRGQKRQSRRKKSSRRRREDDVFSRTLRMREDHE